MPDIPQTVASSHVPRVLLEPTGATMTGQRCGSNGCGAWLGPRVLCQPLANAHMAGANWTSKGLAETLIHARSGNEQKLCYSIRHENSTYKQAPAGLVTQEGTKKLTKYLLLIYFEGPCVLTDQGWI